MTKKERSLPLNPALATARFLECYRYLRCRSLFYSDSRFSAASSTESPFPFR